MTTQARAVVRFGDCKRAPRSNRLVTTIKHLWQLCYSLGAPNTEFIALAFKRGEIREDSFFGSLEVAGEIASLFFGVSNGGSCAVGGLV